MPVPGRNQFFGLLLFYFALHVALRSFISPSALELDEAEQLVLTQKWSWGYCSQPPLYTWLQIIFFNLFGPSVFALSVLKNILLFCVYLFIYFSARHVTRNPLAATAAAASLLFFPELCWGSQLDRTHSVLALALISATLLVFLRIAAHWRLRDFVLLGFCAGLALLSKYNSVFFLLGLVIAAVSVPEYRRVLRDKRMRLSLVIGILVILPNAIWVINNPDLAFLTASKFRIGKGASFINFSGIGRLFVASVSTLAPLVLLHLVVFFGRGTTGSVGSHTPAFRLLMRTALAVLCLFAIGVLVSGATTVRERWVLPALIFTPILSILFFENRLDALRAKWIFRLAVAAMLAVTTAFTLRIVMAEKWKRPERLTLPWDKLASQMRAPLADAPVVITETALIGGGLRLNNPGKTYAPIELATLLAPDSNRFALVWDAGKRDRPTERTLQFLAQAGVEFNTSEAQYFTAVRKFHRDAEVRYGLAIFEKQKTGWPLKLESR